MHPNLQSEKPEMLRVRSLPQQNMEPPKASTFSRPACASMLRPLTHRLFVGREELDLYSGPYISSVILAQFLFFFRACVAHSLVTTFMFIRLETPKP